MSMIISKLPYELILNTICMLTDIRDIMSLIDSNPDIKKLIIYNFNYIIKKIEINLYIILLIIYYVYYYWYSAI